MWEPLLHRHLQHCSLLGSNVSPSASSVFCLFAPPRYAIGELAYAQAQLSLFETYGELHLPSIAVALQDDAWHALQRDRRRRLNRKDVDDYVHSGGSGIVAALLVGSDRPPIIQLEPEFHRNAFDELTRRGLRWMEAASPLLTLMIEAYDRATLRCSPRLVQMKCLVDDHRNPDRGAPLSPYLDHLSLTAASLVIPVPVELTVTKKISELQTHLNQDAIAYEESKLRREVRANAERGAIPPRAALELYLHELLGKRPTSEHDALANACRLRLDDSVADHVDDQVIRYVSRAITEPFGDYLGPGFRMNPDNQDRPHRGHAELILRLLELAILLDVDVSKYTALRCYSYHAYLYGELDALCDYAVGAAVTAAIRQLEDEVLDSLVATPFDRKVVELTQTFDLVRELTKFRLGYDDDSQGLLQSFSIARLWEELRLLDPQLPEHWKKQAHDLDSSLDGLVELVEESVRRAKLIGHRLLRELISQKLERVILVCDSYFQPILRDVFGNYVSYSMLLPNF